MRRFCRALRFPASASRQRKIALQSEEAGPTEGLQLFPRCGKGGAVVKKGVQDGAGFPLFAFGAANFLRPNHPPPQKEPPAKKRSSSVAALWIFSGV